MLLPDDGVRPDPEGCVVALTEEAAITPLPGEDLRVEPDGVANGIVAQGQPLLRLRSDPEIALVAPMAGRVAALDLQSGHRLTQAVVFRERDGERHRFATAGAQEDAGKLRTLMQGAGLWRALRSRPFGRMPRSDERPAAIFVTAVDTRPGAPDARTALDARETDFERGLAALARIAGDGLYLCEPAARPLAGPIPAGVRRIGCGKLHPQGLAGVAVHRHFPPTVERRVWDIHAEDVADLGALLADGHVPETRLVAVTGAALRRTRLVRCQPGADLRALCRPVVRPGPHEVLTGSALDGQVAHWLGARDRQVTVLPHAPVAPRRHWFGEALGRAARHLPVIPTAALQQALGGILPAAALVRALAAGDRETAVRLGVLALVEEDLALADYVTNARPQLSRQLRAMLEAIEAEEVPA